MKAKLPKQAYGTNPVVLETAKGKLTDSANSKAVIDATSPASDAGLTVATGGYLGQAVSKADTESSEAVGLTAAVVILLFGFGTATAMLLPIVSAVLGLVASLALIGFLGHAVEVPTVKEFGIGLAAAIAIDATIVRCLAVPAVMALFGKAAWWLPRWLDRALPKISIEGGDYFAEHDEPRTEGDTPPVPAGA